jgi:endonuclease/exonuclease/phosphatase (EEP) superfamily protein YafD
MTLLQSLKSIVICLVFAFILFACSAVPKQEQFLSAGLHLPPQKSNGTCLETIITAEQRLVPTAGLSPDSISIFDWNMYKGSLEGWESDFLRLSEGKDIILLQEASLDERLQKVLQQQNLYWNLNNAFSYNGNATGVLLGSTTPAIASCGQRTREPIIGVPKTILISRYAIENSEKELLVVNIHGINISLGTGSYQEQFDELEGIIQNHHGPLILAGDFNNWSDGRSAIMNELANDLSLQRVRFADEARTTFFGDPVDHILYRGLKPLSYKVHRVESSDHNPISVTFRLAGTEAEQDSLSARKL